MKHSMQSSYPASRDVVLRMFADRDFHERKLQHMGIESFEVLEHEAGQGRFRIKIARNVPINLPGLKKASGTSRVVHTEDWDLDSGTATINAEPKGMPLEMRCAARIDDDGADACIVHYDWEIKASVPVVGRKLEQFVATDMEARAADEVAAGCHFLDAYR